MDRKTLASEQGMALPLVLIITVCIIMLAFSFVYMFGARARLNKIFVNRNSASYYAEAGIEQYIWNLNQDDYYYATHHTVASAFEAGYYYIEATDPTVEDPTVTLRSTGWLASDPDNRETIEVKLRKRQFTQYVYLTDIEEASPPAPTGTQVWWSTGDVMHNSMHTNGVLNFKGSPRFEDTVTFSGVTTYTNNNFDPWHSYNGPQFYKNGQLSNWQTQSYRVDAILPKGSNSELITYAQSNGYYFPHRTSIYLHDSEEATPRTLMDIYYWDGSQFVYQENLPLPANGVVYVNGSGDYAGVSAGKRWQSYNKSYSAMIDAIEDERVPQELDVFNPDRGNVFISGKLRGRLTVASANHIFITPEDPTGAYDPDDLPEKPGLVYGSTTFNEDGTVLDPGTNDMLGLCANGYIYILHNFWPSYPGFVPPADNYGITSCDITKHDLAPNEFYIQGALYAMPNGAFTYQDYWMDGLKGRINLVGSIIQHYRGVRGLIGSTGYNANYTHDRRMAYATPPHFLSPLNAGWGIVSWVKKPAETSVTFKPITGITVYGDGGATEAPLGTDLQMYATVEPDDATAPSNLVWTVRNNGEAAANIDRSTGLLAAGIRPGTVTVTAQAADAQPGGAIVQRSTTLTITLEPVTGITVTAAGGAASMFTNTQLQMQKTVTPGDASIKTVQWSVDDPALADIVPNGAATAVLTAKSLSPPASTATVQVAAAATDGSGVVSNQYAVTIVQQVTGITVTPSPGSVRVNRTLQMNANVTPSNAYNKSVIWSCTNSPYTHASIDSGTGLLTAGGSTGSVTVRATAQDGSGVFREASISITSSSW
jgi:uncharacterized protein YjdB